MKTVGDVVLGRYRIASELCEGGMGTVYLGRQEPSTSHRPVVIKWITPLHLRTQEVVEWLEHEVKKLKQLRHAGIAPVLDFGIEDHSYFLVSEYVHGYDLKQWHAFMRDAGRQFPTELAIHVAIEVLRALHYAHTAKAANGSNLNIVHRDVRPTNVFVDTGGRIKIADFGIARISAEGTSVTDPAALQKIGYFPPEIVANSEIDARSDVYGVGLLLHELLVGKNEFVADSPPAAITAVLRHEPSRADRARADVSPAVASAIARSLAKKPSDRFASAAEFAETLLRARSLDEPAAINQLRNLAGADFHTARLIELSGMASLEVRDRLLSEPIRSARRSSAPPPAPVQSAETKERMRFATAGEVQAPPPRVPQVVWRAAPASPRSVATPRVKPAPTLRVLWLAIAVAVLVTAVAVVLALS